MANSDWLDTHTKALLGAVPPEKLAPATTEGYTLVLLKRGATPDLVTRALKRILADDSDAVTRILEAPCPSVIARRLSEEDALLGQFELVCADSVSVFVRDQVVSEGEEEYLSRLLNEVWWSPEFDIGTVLVSNIPDNAEGRRFWDQFVGTGTLVPVVSMRAMRKKVRIMEHWAQKIRATVSMCGDPFA